MGQTIICCVCDDKAAEIMEKPMEEALSVLTHEPINRSNSHHSAASEVTTAPHR